MTEDEIASIQALVDMPQYRGQSISVQPERILALAADRDRLMVILRRIEVGFSFPEDDVQRAVRDTIREAIGPRL